MTDTLHDLWLSTADLYAAHDLDAASVPPSKRRKYFAEEADELKEESIINGYDVADEAADVLVTVCGLLQAHGVTLADFEAACQRVKAKNDAKREPAYTYTDGKIRRQKVETTP